MKFKKVFGVLLATCMCCLSSLMVSAADSSSVAEIKSISYATVTNSSGEIFDVAVRPSPMLRNADGEIEQTLRVTVNSDTIAPRSRASQTTSDWDDSASVEGIVKVTYTKNSIGGGAYEYLLTKVDGSWSKSETATTLSNREVIYTCQDPLNTKQWTKKNPTSNNFSYNTNYRNYVLDAKLCAMGASTFVDIRHGGSNVWTLNVVNTVFEDLSWI